ncbi:MAG: hypothetical protein NTX25_03120 [Proteobacteria bacterium]|nr:hypothetical protein [Pseudomonadota bacterium]
MNQSRFADYLAFYKRLVSVPIVWKIWLILLLCLNLFSAYILIGEPRGFIILASLGTGGILGPELYRRFGYRRILGLMHIPWIPMNYLLWAGPLPASDIAATAVQATIVTNVVCLCIDTVDVARYMLGDRSEVGSKLQA